VSAKRLDLITYVDIDLLDATHKGKLMRTVYYGTQLDSQNFNTILNAIDKLKNNSYPQYTQAPKGLRLPVPHSTYKQAGLNLKKVHYESKTHVFFLFPCFYIWSFDPLFRRKFESQCGQ